MLLLKNTWPSQPKSFRWFFHQIQANYYVKRMTNEETGRPKSVIREGRAEIAGEGNVFYNPVQEFNRDLSTCVLSTFARRWAAKAGTELIGTAGEPDPNGLNILEALSATGLRSIRYAKEVIGVKEISANDISRQAVEAINSNVAQNSCENIIKTTLNDAIQLMATTEKRFSAVDLDPYGCPSRFLDSAVRSVADGGLLLVTATDMAILCGNTPETCFAKYGSVSVKMKACHEQAIRILLRCIESHANRYGRYITPLLSISVDFYIRVFVRVNSSQQECKKSSSKMSMVYHCCGCDTFTLQPLGVVRPNPTEKQPAQVKFCLPTGVSVGQKCVHCNQSHHLGGPIWTAPIHDTAFIEELIDTCNLPQYNYLTSQKRIFGILSVIQEELQDVPLYYAIEKLCATIKVESIPMLRLRSALLHEGYRVSYSHASKTSVKTDAPAGVLWDIIRCWQKVKPIKKEHFIEGTPLKAILSKEPEKQYNLDDIHPDANPPSREKALVRYPGNPSAYWGPGTRATLMIGEKQLKSIKNQNKYKRNKEDTNSDAEEKRKQQKVEES